MYNYFRKRLDTMKYYLNLVKGNYLLSISKIGVDKERITNLENLLSLLVNGDVKR